MSRNRNTRSVLEALESRALLSAALEIDAVMGGMALVVRGTSGDDAIEIKKELNGCLRVRMNSQELGSFDAASVGRLVVLGGDGNDHVNVKDTNVVAYLFGQGGNDVLLSGGASTVAIGGDGDDKIEGGMGRDLLIGGMGSDDVFGNAADDILVGGYTVYDNDGLNDGCVTAQTNLVDLMREWNRGDGNTLADFVERTLHTTTLSVGGNNAYAYLSSENVGELPATVFDDHAEDRLWGKKGYDLFFASDSTQFGDKMLDPDAVMMVMTV